MTDREKQLQEEADRYRSLVELSPDGIVIHTAGRIVFVNPTAVRLLGATAADQLLNRPVLDFVPSGLRPFVTERIARLSVEGGEAPMAEEIFLRLDGNLLPVEVTAARIAFDNQPSVMVLFRDIGDRLRTESRLVRSEALLAEAQHIARIGSWEWVFQGDAWTWTDETYRLYDVAVDQPLSLRTVLERIPRMERSQIRVIFTNAVLERKKSFQYTHSIVKPDGSVRLLQGFAQLEMDATGGPVRMAGTIQDVTERHRAETEVRKLNEELEARVRARTAELEFANRELESFSYSVSHDLRAPLRAVDGFSQALEEDLGEQLGSQGRDYLRRIRLACERMGQLIDSILDLSRLTRSELQVKKTDLSEIVRQVAAAVARNTPGADRVRFEIAPDIIAPCDPRLIRVAIENLIDNAVKYSARQSHPVVEFGRDETTDGPLYFVRDNGVGFDMAQAGRLFGVFQRMHSADDFPGTGIGLATVQRIIHRHRGGIRAVAMPGEGAAFYFTLGITPNEE